MASVFFDLDGTLINSQHRLYNLFIELCPECKLTYDEYWEIKREGITQQDLLCQYYGYNLQKCSEFKGLWLQKIEDPYRLEQDFLVDGIIDVLSAVKSKHSLFVITNRQSREYTFDEIIKLGIMDYFDAVFVTEQKMGKVELLKNTVPINQSDILVGDAVEDIKYARELGVISCAVSWGIVSYERLLIYKPRTIIRNTQALTSFLIKN